MHLDILLVTNEPGLRRIVRPILFAHGCQLVEARDALHAFALMRIHPPDFILADAALPGLDGDALAALIRAHYPRLPVLLLAPESAPGEPPAAARDRLARPFSGKALVRRIRQLHSRLVVVPPPAAARAGEPRG